MKKLYTTYKFKKFNSARSARVSRLHVKRRNRKYNPHKTKIGKQKLRGNLVVDIPAPNNFSFTENTDDTLEYFEIVKSQLNEGYSVNLDIENIETLTTDTIALQIATIKGSRRKSFNSVHGNAPRDSELRELFLQSGFYNYVQSKRRKNLNENQLIHKITKNKVEPKIAKEACIRGLMHVFKNDEIFDPLYDILIEIMQNTNNHAGGDIRGKYDWWLHVYNDPKTRIAKYTFLDLGYGIFESLPVKTFRRKLGESLGLVHNSDLVKPLFNGEIKSRTAKPERGKGIPQVYQSSQHKAFSSFHLISNNVKVNLKTMETTKLKSNFSGTLFYWELSNN